MHCLVINTLSVIPVSQADEKPEFTKGALVLCYYGYSYGYKVQDYNGEIGV